MSVARLELVLRMLGGVLAGAAAWEVGRNQVTPSIPVLSSWPYLTFIVLCLLIIASFAVAFALAPHVTTRPFFWLLQQVTHTPMADILAAAGGLFVGLLIGALLVPPLSLLPFFGGFLPIVASLGLGYIGMTTVLSHKREIAHSVLVQNVAGRRGTLGDRGQRF